jgi:4-hydroxy-4-methyl-2-oxoglutarate aldolase
MNTPVVPMPPSEVRSADVADAIRRIHGHRCHLLDLTSPTPEKVLCGPAVTIAYVPAHPSLVPPERYTLGHLFYEAVGDEPEGKVLVLASNGHHDASMGGGAKLSRLHNHKLAGLLTDGRLRDLAQLATYDFVTVCRGETTRWGGDEVTAFEAGRPVVVDRVLIRPGDYVFADSGGAVIIPHESVERVLDMALTVAREEADALNTIRDEGTPRGPDKKEY